MDVTGAVLENGLLSVMLARPEPKPTIKHIKIRHDGS
jgi:HSP20 family molecular chaperone IbpA